MTLLAWNAVRSCVVGQADKQGGGEVQRIFKENKDYMYMQDAHGKRWL